MTSPSATARQYIFADLARIENHWQNQVLVEIANNAISRIQIGVPCPPGAVHVAALLPAVANLHSHTFQRAMAGMTEYRTQGRDSFWTWRELMYRFLGQLTPTQIEAIAAMAFVEMQEQGFAAVAEFHYLHHQPGGAPYANIAELSERTVAAACQAGIGLTLLPVLYTYGGAGMQPLTGGQLRFGNDFKQFAKLHEAARAAVEKSAFSDFVTGSAPHSLRAVSPQDLKQLASTLSGYPFHIHAAEQPKEVADVEAWLGQTPVAWFLENCDVSQNWCFIHATHMTEAETARLAKCNAVAGLCPVTESNLGDGIFNGPGYVQAGGRFGIGTDSNICISLPHELRTLEYSQRLNCIERNVMVQGEGSVGAYLYHAAASGGAQALGRSCGAIREGMLADLVAIDRNHISLCALKPEQLIDGWIFAGNECTVTDLWSAGRHSVAGGRHVARDAVEKSYRKAMRELVGSI